MAGGRSVSCTISFDEDWEALIMIRRVNSVARKRKRYPMSGAHIIASKLKPKLMNELGRPGRGPLGLWSSLALARMPSLPGKINVFSKLSSVDIPGLLNPA